jgi:hypothetical protein
VRPAYRLALGLALWLLPAPAASDWASLLPRPAESSLALETFFSFERDSFGGPARPIDWRDTFFKEKLVFESRGYVYHPRFLQYRLTAGPLLSQEKYEAQSVAPGGWNNRTGLEYDVALTLLPEHHYNLHVWAARYEPTFKEHVATSHDRVGTVSGARLQYENRPLFLHAGFVRETTDFGSSTTEVRRASAEAKYF